jgi:phosphate transport system protein
MPVKFDQEMASLMEQLQQMGMLAERMIHSVVRTIVERKPELLQQVHEDEPKMDALQVAVDDRTLAMISVHTPVAADLRLLLMVARVNGELERVGDQAVNICHVVEGLLISEPLKPLEDIPRAGAIAEEMLWHSLHAFRTRSVEEALSVMKQDEQVDRLHDSLFKELLGLMDSSPSNIHTALGLILTIRAIERIADHAVNIAEDTIYMVTGKDVRHLHGPESPLATLS